MVGQRGDLAIPPNGCATLTTPVLVDGRTARGPRHPTQRVRYANDRCLGRLDMARGPRHPSTAFFPLKGEASRRELFSY
ncbi:MAG: hypothetical protein F6K48_25820 [Okeania sp. SIO3H1]|nr:hypothetical protein [Okeania sp. SIO3H1]